MALQTWPASLPQKPLIDFHDEGVAGLNDPEETHNPQRTRTWAIRELSFAFVMTLAQVTALRTFYNTTCGDGCSYFTAPWMATAGAPGYVLRILEGPVVVSLGGGWFRVDIKTEALAGASRTPGYA